MRKKIIAGNWKMNNSFDQAQQLIDEITENLKSRDLSNKEVILCPPFLFIEMVSDYAEDFPFWVGVQNISEYKQGAYTGEIAASMVQSMGVTHAIIGHSERRDFFNETDDILSKKVYRAINNFLTPIFCCGEKLEDRKNGQHFEVVKRQLEDGLFDINKDDMAKVIIAYEPVWAIGTGETATPEQAQEMHKFIRKLIAATFNGNIAEEASIIYGGSIKADNAKEIFAQPDVDGGLIGGASLNASEFLNIVDAME